MKRIPVALLERIARQRNPGVLLRRLLDDQRREAGMSIAVTLYQLPLWLITNAPAKGRLRECDVVVCRLGCTLLAGRCVDRQAARWRSGDRRGKPKFYECQGCAIGQQYRDRLVGYEPPPDSDTPEVLSPSQRRARDRARAVAHETRGDPMREVADMTPDDRTIP